ncbi:MAG: hypothetical protein R3B99_08000 [Polyangiales bacterium]|nr:hypothetical protein [Sandaracinus sp.]
MRLAFVLALALAAPTLASAQPPATSEAEVEARDAFQQGSDAYAEARYGEALRLFRRAFELSGRTALLYNIGLTADRLRDDAAAVEAFERYLASGEDARRDEVERRLAASRARIAANTALVPEPTPTPEPTPPPLDEAPRSRAPLALGLVGAAVAVAGAVLLGVGARQVADVNDTPEGTRDWSEVSGDASRGRALSIVGTSLLAVGTAAGVVSVVLHVASPSDRESVAMVQWRGSF